MYLVDGMSLRTRPSSVADSHHLDQFSWSDDEYSTNTELSDSVQPRPASRNSRVTQPQTTPISYDGGNITSSSAPLDDDRPSQISTLEQSEINSSVNDSVPPTASAVQNQPDQLEEQPTSATQPLHPRTSAESPSSVIPHSLSGDSSPRQPAFTKTLWMILGCPLLGKTVRFLNVPPALIS